MEVVDSLEEEVVELGVVTAVAVELERARRYHSSDNTRHRALHSQLGQNSLETV